ncbi:hypothetical protein ACP4OV_026580 [Aristida adscensionis]
MGSARASPSHTTDHVVVFVLREALARLRPPPDRGLVVLGEVGGAGAIDCATVRCMQPGHITCANYPGKELEGCACVCAPDDGHGCVLYRQDGSTAKCGKKQ